MTCVLVVDDSKFIRTVVDDALTEAGYTVETATNGLEAVDAAAEHRPDVVTMDVEMPTLNGIDAVERIMSTTPTPILMLSAYTDRGAEATLDALERGAVDVICKPNGSDSRNIAHLVEEVIESVEKLTSARVSSLALARTTAAAHSTASARSDGSGSATVAAHHSEGYSGSATTTHRPTADRHDVATSSLEGDVEYHDDPTVVVGASTGGPKIVERLLATLPIELGAKLILVQHMPAEFTARFADRLDRISGYDVREARDGDRLEAGEALVAPGGFHLEVRSNVAGRLRVGTDDSDRVHGVRPAIDVTMRTAADRVSDPLCGVVCSGMGHDGAAGIEAIKRAGGRTIAQDELTSPVFGIPAKAIETGCVDEIVPGDAIARRIADIFIGENDE